jgi:hypothetical protein
VQSDQSCCFHQTRATLPFNCYCLVSFSPSKVRQLSFEYCPLSHEISSGIHHLPHFGRLACHPTPCSQPLLLYLRLFNENLAPCSTPVLWGRFSILLPPVVLVLDCSSLFMLFSFVVVRFSLPRYCVHYVSRG